MRDLITYAIATLAIAVLLHTLWSAMRRNGGK